MSGFNEAGKSYFFEAAVAPLDYGSLHALLQQPEAGAGWATAPVSRELDAGTYLAGVNRFVEETANTTLLQKQYLAYMRSRMSPAAAEAMEVEIARSTEANVELIGQAWMYLSSCGYHLRTRHPETGQVALVGGFGFDEAHEYQTIVPGDEEPWPLVNGTQLHI